MCANVKLFCCVLNSTPTPLSSRLYHGGALVGEEIKDGSNASSHGAFDATDDNAVVACVDPTAKLVHTNLALT